MPDAALISHRAALVNVKLPGSNRVPGLQAGAEIVAAVGGVTTEQRATRQDALDRRLAEQTKTPDQRFGASVLHLLRARQVPDLSALPGVCQAPAPAGKKKARTTVQVALDTSAEQLGCGSLRALLIPDVASKIDGLLWRSDNCDLGAGMNPRAFGDIDPTTLQVSCDVMPQRALLSAGAASPSLQDIQSTIGKSKVTLARTFVELEASSKMLHILGSGHAVTASWRNFVARSNNEHRTLQLCKARTPRCQLLVQASVQHWCKLKHARFVNQQCGSCSPASAPDFESLWEKIAAGEPRESPLPSQHLAPLDVPVPSPRPGPAPRAPPGAAPAPAPPLSAAVANLNCSATKVATFKELGLMVRNVITRGVAAGHPLPKNDRGG